MTTPSMRCLVELVSPPGSSVAIAFVLLLLGAGCGSWRGQPAVGAVPGCFQGQAPETIADPAAAPPPDKLSAPALDRQVIQGVIDGQQAEVSGCYRAGLLRDPKLKGQITLQFAIGAPGTVSWARLWSSTLPDATVPACVGEALCRIKFPPPLSGDAVVVSYPFRFAQPQVALVFEQDDQPTVSRSPACVQPDDESTLFARFSSKPQAPPLDQTLWRERLGALLLERTPMLFRCVREAKAGPLVKGELKLALEITVHGWVSHGAIGSTFPRTPEMERCLQAEVCSWIRPQPSMAKGGDVVARAVVALPFGE